MTSTGCVLLGSINTVPGTGLERMATYSPLVSVLTSDTVRETTKFAAFGPELHELLATKRELPLRIGPDRKGKREKTHLSDKQMTS